MLSIPTAAVDRSATEGGAHGRGFIDVSGFEVAGASRDSVVFTVLTLKHGLIPPTINYETPDPECDLDYVPNVAREAKIRAAMSNSFGFGGTNGCLIFRACES